MKKFIILIIILIFSKIIIVKADDLSSDVKDSSDNIKKSKKIKAEDQIKITLTDFIRDVFQYDLLRSSTINENNRFDINNYSNILYNDSLGRIDFGDYFLVYLDNSFRYIVEGNQLYNIKSDNHSDSNNNRLDDLVREFYFLWKIPVLYPIKITFGRAYFNFGESYVFRTFTDLAYKRKNASDLFNYDEVGVNMLKLSAYFPFADINFIYSPGIPVDSGVKDDFNIQSEQKFFISAEFKVPKVDFGFNFYLDTNLKWAAGTIVTVTASDDLILYTNLALRSKEKVNRLVKLDSVLYQDMNEYEWDNSYIDLSFSGVLFGMNFTPSSLFTIIAELYFNSAGLNPVEEKAFFKNLEDINKFNKSPEYPEMAPNSQQLKNNFSGYYLGILGDSMTNYDVFDLGMFFIFIQVGKDNICSTGLDLSLSSFIYLFDGSGMLLPKIKYNFLKFFALELSSNIYLGCKGSMFGELPYSASFSLTFEIKI